MLKIIKSMGELDSPQLMSVYEESIFEDAKCSAMEIFQAEDAFLSYLREDFFQQISAFYAVWVVDGAYKSALRLEPYRDGILLHALETAPMYRNCGYASELIKNTLAYLRQNGLKKVYSHVNKRNSQSLHLHQKYGFAIVSDSAAYIDGTVTQNSYTLSIQL